MVNTRDVTISRRFGVGAIDTGQKIAEHYRLVERIGSGGTGVVWRAVDERLQRSVAVKQIHIKPSLPEGERDVLRQRAIREARNAARFQHPNAIVVFDITEHNGDPCLVMEYLKSVSLAGELGQKGPLPLAEVARIGEQVASSLIAAHGVGLVHRDVKPGNILLGDHGEVKITDFGISRAAGDVTLTETGLICGTAAYLAPEVARGADPTPAADVFALGATLFHALEGEPPYGANANPLAVLYAAANGQVREPRNAGPATDFLLDLLSPDPLDRPTMTEARDALAAFADADSNAVSAGFVPASEAYGRRNSTAATQVIRQSGRRTSHAGASTPTTRQIRSNPRPPARHDTAAHPPTQAQPAPATQHKRAGKGRAVLIGSGVGAVIAAIAVAISAMSSSDSDSPSVQANPTTSVQASAAPTTTAAVPALGQTANAGTVDIGSAGLLVENFFSNPGGSWSMLTPAAQQVYGSEGEFREYWNERTVNTFASITGSNNSDGSSDMRLASITINGQTKSMVMRVVSMGGGLRIDGDTR
ncbi:serine/threonine-protein kinase [Nocardia mangyaensis]|uniref:serine/threonine-protein kinase n=1 Tax=Nocardia mangyaensis TaxID=2213200 RepID=UPI002676AE0C|nr:serine/threonine-protein kinase [Nocardia mangyaensis]MDO3649132.1 serine/threonine-protein kinase [Nocardia mangyaensis]